MADVLDTHEVTIDGPTSTPGTVPDGDVRRWNGDGVTVTLDGKAHLGETSDFTLRFTDAAGRPVDDLQPYLGAAGHVVVMRADGSTFAHRHAETFDDHGRPVFALPGTTFGPDLDLHVDFDQPGAYRLWAQFRLSHGTVVTAPFVVHVSDHDRTAPEAVTADAPGTVLTAEQLARATGTNRHGESATVVSTDQLLSSAGARPEGSEPR
jgi:Cu+-exporting ATPase